MFKALAQVFRTLAQVFGTLAQVFRPVLFAIPRYPTYILAMSMGAERRTIDVEET